ncbi:MAG: HEPN domain-containing protein, partial [Synechococcaceae cyanobacterium]|nr:HEPN domain-containing protein [Synechococcaceae cyanobacterium]
MSCRERGSALRNLEQAEQSRPAARPEWACFAAHQAVEEALNGLNLAIGQQAWGHTLNRLWGGAASSGLAAGAIRRMQGLLPLVVAEQNSRIDQDPPHQRRSGRSALPGGRVSRKPSG